MTATIPARQSRRILAILVFAALTAASAHAQKMYVTEFSGPVELVRANGTREKLKLWTPIAYGDAIATGSDAHIALTIPGILSLKLPEKSVIGYFFSGPGTDPQPFISLVAGTVNVSRSGSAAAAPQVRDDRPISMNGTSADDAGDNDPSAKLQRCAIKLETLYGEQEKLKVDCDRATETLEAVTNEYRSRLGAASTVDTATGEAGLQNFRATTLYPAEDARSNLIREIQYRTILARTIRNQILSPLYMTIKSSHPDPNARDDMTATFFDRYAAVATRYEEFLSR